MNAQQLKNAILQEAIQGRLVPQDPTDEPASTLLERIRAEKERLVKEGKLKKKDLVVNPISEDEIPFEIPDSWEWCRMSTLIQLLSGQDFPPEKYNSENIGVPYITGASNIDNGKLIINRWTETPSVIGKDGDLLIVCKGSGVGKMCISDVPIYHIARQIQIIRCFSSLVLLDYLKVNIDANLSSIVANAQGVIPGISRDHILDLLLPIPPLAEQKRIVAKIEELLPKVEEYGKAQEALDKLNAELPDRLKKIVLQEAIEGRLVPQDPTDEPASVLLAKIRQEKEQLVKAGKLKKKDLAVNPISEDEIPFEIPDSWEWVRLISLNKYIHYGYTASAAQKGNSKLLRITDIQEDQVNWATVPFCTIKDNELEKYQLHNRVILIARTGGTIGKTYIVRELNEVSVFASYLIRAIPLDNVYEEYLKLFMGSHCYWAQLTDAASGTGQPNVNGQSLSSLMVPLPPLAEQKRIVAKIEEVFAEIDKMKM